MTSWLTSSMGLRYEAIYLAAIIGGYRFFNVGITDSDQIVSLEDAQQRAYEYLFEYARQRAPDRSDLRVIEVGAGLGEGVPLVVDRLRWDYTVLDASWVATYYNRWRGRQASRAMMEALPLGDESVDIAFAVECVCGVPESVQLAFYGELRRVLKRGGLFVSIDFFKPSVDAAAEWIEDLSSQNGLRVMSIDDLTEDAQKTIVKMEPERAKSLESLPGFVGKTAFGQALRNTFCVAGTRRYNEWMNGNTAYVVYCLQRVGD